MDQTGPPASWGYVVAVNKDETVDADRARSRLRDARVGRLGTVNRSGRPHLVPCCFVLVGGTVYSAVDAKPKSTTGLQRLDNVAAHGRASLLVDHYEEDWSQLWWVRVDGPARLIESPSEQWAPRDALVAKYEQYQTVEILGPYIAIEIDRWVTWP